MLRILAIKEERDGLSVKLDFKSIHISPSKIRSKETGKGKIVSDLIKDAWEGIPHERNMEISFRSSHDLTFTISDENERTYIKPYIVLCLNTHIIFLYGKSMAGKLLKDWAFKMVYGEDKILALQRFEKTNNYRVKLLKSNPDCTFRVKDIAVHGSALTSDTRRKNEEQRRLNKEITNLMKNHKNFVVEYRYAEWQHIEPWLPQVTNGNATRDSTSLMKVVRACANAKLPGLKKNNISGVPIVVAYLNSLKGDGKKEKVFHQDYSKHQDHFRYVKILLAFKPNLNGFENCLHDNNEFKISRSSDQNDDIWKLTFIINGVTKELSKSIRFLKDKGERTMLQKDLFNHLCHFDAVLTDFHTLHRCFPDHHIFDQWSCIYRENGTIGDTVSTYHQDHIDVGGFVSESPAALRQMSPSLPHRDRCPSTSRTTAANEPRDPNSPRKPVKSLIEHTILTNIIANEETLNFDPAMGTPNHEPKTFRLKCSICPNKSFISEDERKKHMQEIHGPKGNKAVDSSSSKEAAEKANSNSISAPTCNSDESSVKAIKGILKERPHQRPHPAVASQNELLPNASKKDKAPIVKTLKKQMNFASNGSSSSSPKKSSIRDKIHQGYNHLFKVGTKSSKSSIAASPERPPVQPSIVSNSESPSGSGCSGPLKLSVKKLMDKKDKLKKDKKSKKRKRHRENDNSPPASKRNEDRKEPEKKKRRISKPKNKALDSIPRQNEVGKVNERSLSTSNEVSSGSLHNVLDSERGQPIPSTSRQSLENDSGNESQRNADALPASGPMVNIHDMDLDNTIKKEPIERPAPRMGTITLETILSADSDSEEDERQEQRPTGIANDHTESGSSNEDMSEVDEDAIPDLDIEVVDDRTVRDRDRVRPNTDVPVIKQETVEIPTENATIEEPLRPQMSKKEILAQMKRKRPVIEMRPSETKLAVEFLRNEMERDGRLSIQDFLKRRVNPKIFLVTNPVETQKRPMIGKKVPPLKLSLKRKHGCSQCSEKFDSYEESLAHFDKNHQGLSLEEGNAFPPLKKRQKLSCGQRDEKLDSPTAKEVNAFSLPSGAGNVPDRLETTPQPGPSGLSSSYSNGSSKDLTKSAISDGKTKVKGKKTGKAKTGKAVKRSSEADLNIEKKVDRKYLKNL